MKTSQNTELQIPGEYIPRPPPPIISIFARVLTFLHHDAIKIFRRKMEDGQNFLGIDDF